MAVNTKTGAVKNIWNLEGFVIKMVELSASRKDLSVCAPKIQLLKGGI